MKYKEEINEIPLPHIHCTLILVFTNDLAKCFKKNNVKSAKTILPDASFIINHNEPLRPEIFIDINRNRDILIKTMAHELIHVIEYMWNTLGFPIALSEHEAYMLGYLLGKSIECLNDSEIYET